MTRQFVIRSEDDAYDTLAEILEKELSTSDIAIKLEGWPKLHIHLTGDKYHQTITPSMMKGFLELQKGLYRSYALTKYKSPNSNRLTKEERSELEMEVRVSNGSSNFTLDFQPLIEKFLSAGVDKMDGSQIVMIILGVFLMYTGNSAWKYYLDTRRQEREQELSSEEKREQLQAMSSMSEQETQRAKLMAELARNSPALDNIQRGAYDAQTELLKSMRNADDGTIQGVAVTGAQADLITQNARRKSVEVRLDGCYRIVQVDSSSSDSMKVKIRDVDSDDQYWATVQDETLTDEYKSRLQAAEWDKKPVRLRINAKDKNGNISNAIIIDVQEVLKG
ncbi:MAG: hypothetical protein OIF57_04635 [Marinobacterium sp.]|nr:hypothetical protein [Marinobacterium sp.]